jgi:hypothetical protein
MLSCSSKTLRKQVLQTDVLEYIYFPNLIKYMSSLNLSQFIRPALLEAVKIRPLKIHPGTKVYYDGTTWEAIEQKDGGWVWRVFSGRNPHWNPEVVDKFFSYPETTSELEKSIYNQPDRDNSGVTTGRQPVRDTRKSQAVGILPPEVIDADSAYKYAKAHPGWTAGEHYIKKDPRFSYLYARDVLGERFPIGEPIMKTSPDYWARYTAMVRRLVGK